MWLGNSAELDPVKFGASMQAAKAKEPEKFPCPVPLLWPDFRADQIVAETAKCSVMQVRELPPLDYHEFLFIGSAIEEARPVANAHDELKAKRKQNDSDALPISLGSIIP